MSVCVPELLAPAGNMEKLETALYYGADAVYLGGPELSLRTAATGFNPEQLKKALVLARARQAKVYYALNILAWEHHLDHVHAELELLAGCEPDGLIIADPGIFMLARDIVPHIPIHLSTQANTSNSLSIRFWQQQGAQRVNLARELGRTALAAARQAAPDMELEVFVHGAMCMAVSGRCLMSFYLNSRLANHGLCTHPCRFDYRPVAFRVEEKQRGEEVWDVEQRGDFTRIFGAEDLCLLPCLSELVGLGLTSLKIEGRMKTSSYLAPVVDVYRAALNTLASGGNFDCQAGMAELAKTTTRPLGSGFFLPEKKIFVGPDTKRPQIVARILEPAGRGMWRVSVKSPWSAQSELEVLLPGLRRPGLRPGDYGLENSRGERLEHVHPGTDVFLRCELPELEPCQFLRGS